ncbi:MAG TPA: RsmE family RNA methyltransferase [Bryobacteraceae bacterium]|jgi:16S rRNA (uracil1498-N3)-methyltransferase|nr:RsmE family RNA methyltransferase [Bryobacteraceae bacterium]
MRRRFFVDQIRNGRAEIAGDEAQHLTRVLRVEAGQHYEISDNRDVYLAEIETSGKRQVIFRTIEKLPPVAAQARLVLAAALVKFDHFEWMIGKATELGVDAIVPFPAARSERGLALAARKRLERWRRIALEASQQSRRAHLPVIEAPASFEDVLAAPADRRFALDEDPKASPLLAALPQSRRPSDSIAVLIGPEGGWTDQERECFASWTRVSLGPRILRAETAAIAALAILRAAWDLR